MPDGESTRTLTVLERLYLAAPVGLCYFDSDLCFVHVNEWLARINGFPLEGQPGRTMAEVLPGIGAEAEAELRRLIETGEPNMDGQETLTELRRIRSDVRVVLSSGYDEQEVMGRLAAKGFAGFLKKPYDTDTLIRQLRRALETEDHPSS